MAFSCKLFVLVLLLPIIARCSADSINQECSKNFSISGSDLLQYNINYTFSDLIAKTFLYGFANSSYGTGSDTIHGLTRCRGDISQEACLACIVDAAYKIRTICPFSAEARIWYEYCFLRYDSNNFLGQLDTNYTQLWYTSHLAVDHTDFDQAVGRLLGGLKVAVMLGDKNFGRDEVNLLKSNITIYGMAQCTRDLQEPTCIQCLEKLEKTVSSYCQFHLGCYVISTSCVLRYEINEFLVDSTTPSPNAYAPTSP